jgi:hypothetical protein
MRTTSLISGVLALMAASTAAQAVIVHNYENLPEGFLGTSYTADGITYRDVNNVAGVNPDNQPFAPGELGTNLPIENATFFYNDFPEYGSPNKALTFGDVYVTGDNLSIGALASVYIDYAGLADFASFDIAYYEKGPWGGIVYHLDALLDNQVVASDSFTIASGGDRDNATFRTMSVSGANFNTLHVYATLNGNYTGPRGMIDDLTINPVPEPATLAALGLGAAALIRRRRK